MLELPVMKDPVTGIFSLKFISRCHIDADIGRIPAKSGPNFPSTFAEGDGRAPISSQQKMGPAERVVDHMNWERSSIERMPVFHRRTFHRRNVIQQEGDQAILVFFPVRPASFMVFTITRQGCIECWSPAMIKTHGMDGYALVILIHIDFHLSMTALLTFEPNSEPLNA
jgi:hypothetical protein